MASYIPPEIILMIFQEVDDRQTKLNIRMTSRLGRDFIEHDELFATLKLHANRRRAANRVAEMIKLGLTKYIQELIICTSSYVPTAVHVKKQGWYDVDYWHDEEKVFVTDFELQRRQKKTKAEEYNIVPVLVGRAHQRQDEHKMFKQFLSYVLQCLSSRRRDIRLSLITQRHVSGFLDTVKNLNARRTLFEGPSRLQVMENEVGSIFHDVLKNHFRDWRQVYDLNITEIKYNLTCVVSGGRLFHDGSLGIGFGFRIGDLNKMMDAAGLRYDEDVGEPDPEVDEPGKYLIVYRNIREQPPTERGTCIFSS